MNDTLKLIQEMGSALCDHDHQWSDELRKLYTKVTNELKKEDKDEPA
jgi:hypothetical protein